MGRRVPKLSHNSRERDDAAVSALRAVQCVRRQSEGLSEMRRETHTAHEDVHPIAVLWSGPRESSLASTTVVDLGLISIAIARCFSFRLLLW